MSLPISFFHNNIQLGGGQWLSLYGENNIGYSQQFQGSYGRGNTLRWNDNLQAAYYVWDTSVTGSTGTYSGKIDKEGTDTHHLIVQRTGNWEGRSFDVKNDGKIMFLAEGGGTSYLAQYDPATNNFQGNISFEPYKYMFDVRVFQNGGNDYYIVSGRNGQSGDLDYGYGQILSSAVNGTATWGGHNVASYCNGILHDFDSNKICLVGNTSSSRSFVTFHDGGFSQHRGGHYADVGGFNDTNQIRGADWYGGHRNLHSGTGIRRVWAVGFAYNGSNYHSFLVSATSTGGIETNARFLADSSGNRLNKAAFWDAKYDDINGGKVYTFGVADSRDTNRGTSKRDGTMVAWNVSSDATAPTIDKVWQIRQNRNSTEYETEIINGVVDDEGFIILNGRYRGQSVGTQAFIARIDPANPYTGVAGPLTFHDTTSQHTTNNAFGVTSAGGYGTISPSNSISHNTTSLSGNYSNAVTPQLEEL